ncbi:homoserine kinase [Luteipulveratus halotolerans]|uniref:Homoserine kinase n=1 Tax=Luteipulveratus halotolerans TaxID=1631356 RepID=A0A0L6CFP1_9MICO|nr:homoserine kinase [Luteipulveratus halotolerans]KNX36607.1 serine kinase [Luteipulveratus halotolerans]
MARAVQPGAAVTVTVPASSANLGPGFDSVGLALDVRDEVSAVVRGDTLVVRSEGEGADEVPRDETHLVHRAMVAAWQHLGVEPPRGLELTCRGAIPHSRGLGSSASAIVAGASVAAALAGVDLGAPEGLAQVNDVASTLEGHPDNASASVYGGLTVSWADDVQPDRWRTTALTVHADLRPVVLVPEDRLATHEARAALPPEIGHADAARNAGRAALLTHALTHDPALLLPATRDWLHQEQRRIAYPVTMAMVDRLRRAGHAAVVSGAGPSVLVLATVSTADAVAATAREHAGWNVLQPQISATGVRVV